MSLRRSRHAKGKRRAGRQPKGPLGKVSRSQTVTTYGPGSLYELRTFRGGVIANSVIVAGTHLWPDSELSPVSERSLAASLGVDRFLLPPSAEDEDNPVSVPAYRFPEWLECNRCHRIGHMDVHFDEQVDAPPRCSANDCDGYGVPTRLVIACFTEDEAAHHSSPGHLDNFPWTWWAHSNSEGGTCDDPQIYMDSDGKKTGIAGLVVRCQSCNKHRSLDGVFGNDALKGIGHCSGYRPWLGSKTEDGVIENCDRPVRALLRGASNIYFPVTASAISIPPTSSRIVQLIETKGKLVVDDLKACLREGEEVDRDRYVRQCQNGIPGCRRYEKAEIRRAIDLLIDDLDAGEAKLTESQQKMRERNALVNDSQGDPQEDEFENIVLGDNELSGSPLLSTYLQSVSKVRRLREVRAIRGFQRVESSPVADSYSQACAPLSKFREDWLPAIDNRGEGIYLEISRSKLAAWESSEAVVRQVQPLVSNFERHCSDLGIPCDLNFVSPGYLLVHTLSHLLIKQLSLECGYSSASIRERIYYGSAEDLTYCGVLLYTAAASADGTLGGLVRQAEPKTLNALLTSALENARWCSSDPLCIESEGQGVDALNLAACHSCALVSETSCEQRNLLLDRTLVVGTAETPELGFFYKFLQGGI